MSKRDPTFADLMDRVRAGDADAFSRVLEEYGQAIQREARFTLLDKRVRQFVGESDVYQSVVLRFFTGMRNGQFSFQTADDLTRLLKGITRTRIAELIRFWHAQRRDVTRTTVLANAELAPLNECKAEDAAVEGEMIAAAEQLLSPRDRQVLMWRNEHLSWQEIANRLSLPSGDAARKSHERSLAHIAEQLASQRRGG